MAKGVSTYTKLNAFNFTHYYDYINFRAGPPDDVSVFEVITPPPKIVSENDKEIPQTQTADNPMAPRGRAAQPSRGTRKTN